MFILYIQITSNWWFGIFDNLNNVLTNKNNLNNFVVVLGDININIVEANSIDRIIMIIILWLFRYDVNMCL